MQGKTPDMDKPKRYKRKNPPKWRGLFIKKIKKVSYTTEKFVISGTKCMVTGTCLWQLPADGLNSWTWLWHEGYDIENAQKWLNVICDSMLYVTFFGDNCI